MNTPTINKTRRKLVWGYTFVIIIILVLSTMTGMVALNYFTNTAMERSLMPELEAEVAESRRYLREWRDGIMREPMVTHFDSYELAFTVMEYWFSPEGELVMAEGSVDVSDLLMSLIKGWSYSNQKIEELRFFDDDNKEWEFIVIADDVYDDDGTYLGKVIVGTNMTPLTRINAQYMQTALVIILLVSVLAFFAGNYFAAKAIRPIAEMMEKQKSFVSDASHELRTPLSVMLASVDMLEPAENFKQNVDDMRAEIMIMRNLVNSLLTLARSDNNKYDLCLAELDLCELGADVVRKLQHLADVKNIKIVYAPEKSLLFYGDEIKLRQLLTILLDNAVKYSAENMVVLLNITLKHNRAVITVQDYGIGISPQDLPHIFERFYRADKSRSRALGGTGLGLSIGKLIVEAHQGTITAESILGQGSVFTVVLPVKTKKFF